MDINRLQISKKISNQLLHNAKSSPNLEICGLIGIINGCCNTCYPINNTAQQPETKYQLDAKQQITAFAKMRKNNEKQFAIYHSHPTAPAIPSITDIELATYPDAIYLIISINNQPNIRGFTIKDKVVQELSLNSITN